jgi:hypothetical protein
VLLQMATVSELPPLSEAIDDIPEIWPDQLQAMPARFVYPKHDGRRRNRSLDCRRLDTVSL